MPSEFLPVPLRAVPNEPGWVIDCDACAVRGDACQDCVVSVMLGGPPDAPLEPDAHRALTVLADAGLVPPLQMTPAGDDAQAGDGSAGDERPGGERPGSRRPGSGRPSDGRPGAPGNDTA